jgi:hypothetical protein
MTYRRRHRWLRRFAFGLAFAAFAAPAAAKPDEGGAGSTQVIPYLSHGILTEADQQIAAAEAIHDPYMTDVFVRQLQNQFVQGVTDFPRATNPVEPRIVVSYLSHGMAADGEVGARPDDRADRFALSDVEPRTELSSGGWNVEWNEAVTVGIGALVLALALGLGLGYLKRPKLAGL